MVDIQTISIAIASASVVVGIVYYAFQVRHQTRLREMDLILRLDAKWMDNIEQCWQVIRKTEFKNFDDYEDKCPLEVAQVAGFFESLGLLLRRGLVDIDIVSGLFIMEPYWQKLKLWVEGKRERESITQDPTFILNISTTNGRKENRNFSSQKPSFLQRFQRVPRRLEMKHLIFF